MRMLTALHLAADYVWTRTLLSSLRSLRFVRALRQLMEAGMTVMPHLSICNCRRLHWYRVFAPHMSALGCVRSEVTPFKGSENDCVHTAYGPPLYSGQVPGQCKKTCLLDHCQTRECRQVGQVICNAEQPKIVGVGVAALKLQRLQIGQLHQPLQQVQPSAPLDRRFFLFMQLSNATSCNSSIQPHLGLPLADLTAGCVDAQFRNKFSSCCDNSRLSTSGR